MLFISITCQHRVYYQTSKYFVSDHTMLLPNFWFYHFRCVVSPYRRRGRRGKAPWIAKASLQPEMSRGFKARSASLPFCLHSCTKATRAQKAPRKSPGERGIPFMGASGPQAAPYTAGGWQSQAATHTVSMAKGLSMPWLLPPTFTSLLCYQTLVC